MITGQDLIRLALWAAQSEAAGLDAGDQALLISAVQMNLIERFTLNQRGLIVCRALMSPYPLGFFAALRVCGGLRRLLPEVDGLFGVSQVGVGDTGALSVVVDSGQHHMRALTLAARNNASLPVRIATLLHGIGKAATPSMLRPAHFGHQIAGLKLLDTLAQRMTLPAPAVDLAAVAIAECERVHGVRWMRTDEIIAMLARIQVQTYPERFEQLLEICRYDHQAWPGHEGGDYAPASLWGLILNACRTVGYTASETEIGAGDPRLAAIERSLARYDKLGGL